MSKKYKRRRRKLQSYEAMVTSTKIYNETFEKKKGVVDRLKARLSVWKKDGGQVEEMPDIIAIECIKIATESTIAELLNARAEVSNCGSEDDMYEYLTERLLELRGRVDSADSMMNIFSTKK